MMRDPIKKTDVDSVRRHALRQLLQASGALASVSLYSLSAFAAAASGTMNDVRVEEHSGSTRVVFDLSGRVGHRMFALRHPDRLVIDFQRCALNGALRVSSPPNAAVKRIRYGKRSGGDLRVVLDLDQPAEPSASLIKGNGAGYRLVVNLGTGGAVQQQPVPVADVHKQPLRDVVVMIDPGHGGKDPGAIGKFGTYEKDVVLPVGHHLHRTLGRERGIQTLMTRQDDVFLPLTERVRVAHHHRADLFVSIHADASTDRRVRGSSVYVLSEHGASSVMARRLAARENSSDSLVGGVDLSDKSKDVASMLLDLSQSATLESSYDLAHDLLQEFEQSGRVLSSRVERAAFVVLKSPDIPSALVETGFISNPHEERRLRSSTYQEHLAGVLHNGIRDYFRKNAPHGTMLAEG